MATRQDVAWVLYQALAAFADLTRQVPLVDVRSVDLRTGR